MIVRRELANLPVASIKRRLGFPSGTHALEGTIAEIFQQSLAVAKTMIDPVTIYRFLTPRNRTSMVITFEETDVAIESEGVVRLLLGASYTVLFFSTIGPALPRRIEERSDAGDLTASVILDAAASESAEAVADDFHRGYMKQKAAESGFSVTARYSPGYGDWPLNVQSDLARICRAENIGVTVNQSSFLQPAKTVSAVFGLMEKEGENGQ